MSCQSWQHSQSSIPHLPVKDHSRVPSPALPWRKAVNSHMVCHAKQLGSSEGFGPHIWRCVVGVIQLAL